MRKKQGGSVRRSRRGVMYKRTSLTGRSRTKGMSLSPTLSNVVLHTCFDIEDLASARDRPGDTNENDEFILPTPKVSSNRPQSSSSQSVLSADSAQSKKSVNVKSFTKFWKKVLRKQSRHLIPSLSNSGGSRDTVDQLGYSIDHDSIPMSELSLEPEPRPSSEFEHVIDIM